MSHNSETHPNWGDPKHFKYFSQNRINLAQELKHHPDMIELIQKYPQDEFEMIIAEIAGHCKVALHGDYFEEDMDELCGVLCARLKYKRTGLLIAKTLPPTEPK